MARTNGCESTTASTTSGVDGPLEQSVIYCSIDAYQFFSRLNLENKKLEFRVSGSGADGSTELDFEVTDSSFELVFASIVPTGPSIGASQYVNPEEDDFMAQRWTKCIRANGQVGVREDSPKAKKIAAEDAASLGGLCREVKRSLWMAASKPDVIPNLDDQRSRLPGYRRSYGSWQMFDISGNRRPSRSEYYHVAQIGDFIGPGLVSVGLPTKNLGPFEYVWSEIISFPHPTDPLTDLIRIRKILQIQSRYLHGNSYVELEDARRHCKNEDIRAAVRSGASAVDAGLRYFCRLRGVRFPRNGSLQFHEKIEKALSNANMPSYQAVDPEGLEMILYLYRARNAMREGDRYYVDSSGTRVDLYSSIQVEPLLDAAEQFLYWLEARA